MANKYVQMPQVGQATRFSKSPMAEVEFSRLVATPTWLLPFNAGDIVPVYYAEVLPHDTFSIDLDFVIRQTTVLRPTMGNMQVDFFAYFVPNRIVNDSWKNVMGENTSGFWTAPEVDLAPLYHSQVGGRLPDIQIPIGSVADYYGFPTQLPIKAEVLEQCNDLKFRGYIECYNHYFRDQNYQPPIPYSKLNVYEGFLAQKGTLTGLGGAGDSSVGVWRGKASDGSFPDGSLLKNVYGEGVSTENEIFPSGDYDPLIAYPRLTAFSALDKPLKANKLHDAFTSALPSPQKGAEVVFGIGGQADVKFDTTVPPTASNANDMSAFTYPLKLLVSEARNTTLQDKPLWLGSSKNFNTPSDDTGVVNSSRQVLATNYPTIPSGTGLITDGIYGWNMQAVADLSKATGISVNDLRIAIATQSVYETLARGGSRYTSVLRNFFELDIESPFADIPTELGHIRRDLDLYQVAQTSSSDTESPQGNLTAFGYTTNGGKLFTKTFLEHGYIHIFAIVRHRNIYSTFFAPDNFRKSTLDFYLPQLANIGEQPIPLRTLNPFVNEANEKAIGFQEAWWEYRYEPDRVHGEFRTGVDGSLAVWNYADEFDSTFDHINGDWLKSNSEEVLNRTLAVTSELAPQFKGMFRYKVDKQRPMPTYSIPGLDTI